MSAADRQRWDPRHRGAPRPAPSARLQALTAAGAGGLPALDLACGLGADALLLAARDYRVDAVDVSLVALVRLRAEARARGLEARIQPLCADLDAPPLRQGAARYALVVVRSFLDRNLLQRVPGLLRPGGILFFETFHAGHGAARAAGRPEWLLARAEAARLLPELGLLECGEDAERAYLVAGRPPLPERRL